MRSTYVAVGEERGETEDRPRRHVDYASLPFGIEDGTTIPDLFNGAVAQFGEKRATGIRRVIKTTEKKVHVRQSNGSDDAIKLHRIPWLSDYQWTTFDGMQHDVSKLQLAFSYANALLPCTLTGQSNKLAIFASTRPEWQTTAQAVFASGAAVVTVYPSLGADALAFSLNQTRVPLMLTEVALLKTVVSSAGSLQGHLQAIIYLDTLDEGQRVAYEKQLGVRLVAYQDLLNLATPANIDELRKNRPTVESSDLALIMYTSGSTGIPKGVMMSHRNVVAAVRALSQVPPEPISPDDVFLSYLPLSHVLSLVAEITMLCNGCPLGYGSPATLRDDGANDAQGNPAGDLTVLKPTLMVAVPLILDRLRSAIQDSLTHASWFSRMMFRVAYWYKQRKAANSPSGITSTPWLDRFVFSKVAARFGGRIRYLLSGGAPLSVDTQVFIQNCLSAPVLQGFGLTETCGVGSITHPEDRPDGSVGAPLACCQIKLVDEAAMGYTHNDQPRPRGQIYIGGPHVTMGYYKNEELTAESYYTDPVDGTRWFATGDVGEWDDHGTLRIVDRKKDLVKLAHGEYVAIGNLEALYAQVPLVDQIALVADSHHSSPVALIVPNRTQLHRIALAVGIPDEIASDHATICLSLRVECAVREALDQEATRGKLQRWERIAAVHLLPDPWTLENGLLTDAMKLKRQAIQQRFAAEIVQLYRGVP